MSVQRGDHELRRLLQPQQRLVRMQAEVVFELRRHLGQHLDVGPGGEELLSRAAHEDDVDLVIHASLQDALIQLAIHFVRVGIGRRIIQFEDRHTLFHSVID